MTEPTSKSPSRGFLKLRKRAKRKKPKFVRPESWRYVRLKENWRRPRGLDNKVRKRVKGWPPIVSAGYRGPKVARGLHPSGFEEVLVQNPEQLKGVDPKTHAVRIAHTVGKRKRTRILAEAKKKKITILNFKELKETVKKEKESAEETSAEKEELEVTKETEKKDEKKQEAERSKQKAKEQ